ncbi:4-alpha-glucanotransferase [Deltaproteobacteria bacterium TL4]
MKRSSGILLHPTSLPNPYGIGDFGPSAYVFIDFLKKSKQHLWQILPLGVPSYGNSPYQCLSAFAGNPLLISPELLVKEALLPDETLKTCPEFNRGPVDYERVSAWKNKIFQEAFHVFKAHQSKFQSRYQKFNEEHQHWLSDFVQFMALKEAHNLTSWNLWSADLALRKKEVLDVWCQQHQPELEYHQFLQFLFHEQWAALREYAHRQSLSIIGDLPIFVAYDSADVWSHPELYFLDERQIPTVVAGVPPDYFSNTGQRWGNPLYRWDVMKTTEYSWWQQRLRYLLTQVDQVRIDHFRGFEQYWEIPATEETAIRGRWVDGPKRDFFDTLKAKMGTLPIIAEDLGIITPEVEALRDEYSFPGMKILQFAFFEGKDNPYLPHHYEKNTVVYTGTHDNNTTRGWFADISEGDKKRVENYCGKSLAEETICAELIRLAWASTSKYVIVPLQDVLKLDASARMNFPGTTVDNWGWRYEPSMLTEEHSQWLVSLTEIYQRC